MIGVVMARGSGELEEFLPLLKQGNLTNVRRTVLNFLNKGLKDVIVVVGEHGEEVEISCAKMDVVFYYDEEYREHTFGESVLAALDHFNLEEDVIYSTTEKPFFQGSTVEALMKVEAPAAAFYQGARGNLLKLTVAQGRELVELGQPSFEESPEILTTSLKAVEVGDPGVLFDGKEGLLQAHNRQLLRSHVKLSIARENRFFGPGVRRLLRLIDGDGSVKNACQSMGLSYSKAWKMINTMEEELGFPVIVRRAGGAAGGESYLTPEGKIFLEQYEELEEKVTAFSERLFEEMFLENPPQ